MRPTDVLAYRRVLLDTSRQIIGDDLRDAGARELARDVAEIVNDCEAYYVSADMTAVALHASRTMPSQILRRDDLPSERGFLVYDRPVGEWTFSDNSVDVVGFAWGSAGEGEILDHDFEGCACPEQPYCGHCLNKAPPPCTCPPSCDCAVIGYGQEFNIFPLAQLTPGQLAPLSNVQGEDVPGGDPGHDAMAWVVGGTPINDRNGLASVLLATWTLMQQSLSVSGVVSADRPERRRCYRANLPSNVIVVRLRRKSLDEPQDEVPEVSGHWSHRWLVSGHWRNQWLPSRMCHRIQWIHGYVKGPQHKPLLVKDRVTAWVR